MAEWAHAISQGIAGAAKTGADIIGQQMAQTAQMEAEQRAADRQLDTASRMMAIQEAMQTRAAERFSGVVKAKMGEEIPMEAPGIDATGITRESAGEADGIQVALRPENIAAAEKVLRARMDNPDLPEADRIEARDALEQLERQKTSQGELNAKSVEGKSRKRTLDEATDAAREDTLMNDAGAYMAGTGMLAAAGKSKAEQAKLESRAEIERNKITSREALEREKIAQREADSVRDNDVATARVKAIADRAAATGKGGNKTAMIQNIEFMTSVLKYTPEQVEAFVFEKKGISEKELAANILSKDKYGEMTPADAAAKARELSAAFAAPAGKPSPASTAPARARMKWNPATGKFE